MKNANAIVYIIIGILFIVILSTVSYAQLSGQSSPLAPRTLTRLRSERINDSTWTINTNAIAGNVTELYLNATTVTQNWQGFFGNVTGVITLDDYNNRTLYDWDLASPEGEVIAATTQYISWETALVCANDTTLNIEEGRRSIKTDDFDGINETFVLKAETPTFAKQSHNHSLFFVANWTYNPNTCPAANLYVNDNPNETFEQVALWHEATSTMIWVSLLEESTPVGFDGNPHDFEMIVPENGSAANRDTTTYYFWVELE